VTEGTSGRKSVKRTSRRRSNIPTGTVTFLFTDIEGSTAMWEDHPDQMQQALARHDEILHAAIEARGGYVFKMMGDACYAAFSNTREALEATLAAQRALFAEKWEKGTEIRVRMALHTGVPEEKDGDYFGPPVNRVARLLSAGHGGQILLSAVTYGLVRDVVRHMESGAELRDLGEYRLRDLRYTERIYHLVVPDLPSEFPTPKGEPITAGTLPDQQTPPRPQEQQTPPPRPQEETPAPVVESPPPAAQPKEEEHAAAAAPPRADRYTRKRTIGGGGMAQVYLAHDEVLDRDVALKVLRQQYADDERLVERFRREAKNAASLSHPNIVAVHDRGETEDGAYYIVMEYMAGGTLKDRIQKEGPLPPAVATTLALQIARALEAAHRRGIIHRDVKPQNVLLTEDGEAKVADFGIARAASSSTMTKTGSVLGTAHYLSPEQALGQPASPQSDLYSLGVVLYEMLTGELPYDAETPMGIAMKHVSGQMRPPKEVNPNVPEGINAVTVRLLAPDPEDRYKSAAEVVEDLERVQREEAPVVGAAVLQAAAPVSAPPAPPPDDQASADLPPEQGSSEAPTVPQPVHPAPGRGALRRVPVLAGLLGLLAVAGIAAWLLVPSSQDQALEVPSLEGENLAAARQEVGGDFDLVSSEEASTQPKGTILSQDPKPGAEVKQGEEISVTVSSGSEEAAVPDVVGRSKEEAEQTLQSQGFDVKVQTQESSEDDVGKVVEQSPSGGKAKPGSEVAITVGQAPKPAPGYAYVEDATGRLSVEVPSDWETMTSEHVTLRVLDEYGNEIDQEEPSAVINAAPDLANWQDTSAGAGTSLLVVEEFAQKYTNDELINSIPALNWSHSCTQGAREDLNRDSYSGRVQWWNYCNLAIPTFVTLAAAPEGRECAVVGQIGMVSEDDRAAAQRILETFKVDCGNSAGGEPANQGVAEVARTGDRSSPG
jgi:class 3 adenylate cyclase/tRNA A-37 threonylcarbamoyl transferase component Bud32